MTLLVQALEPAVFDLCVELRGGDAGVAEQFLDSTNITARLKQVTGK